MLVKQRIMILENVQYFLGYEIPLVNMSYWLLAIYLWGVCVFGVYVNVCVISIIIILEIFTFLKRHCFLHCNLKCISKVLKILIALSKNMTDTIKNSLEA